MSMEHDFPVGTPASTSIGVTTTEAVPANSGRAYAALVNDSDEVMYLGLGAPAVMNKGVRLNANGGSFEIAGARPYRGAINAICASGSKVLVYIDSALA